MRHDPKLAAQFQEAERMVYQLYKARAKTHMESSARKEGVRAGRTEEKDTGRREGEKETGGEGARGRGTGIGEGEEEGEREGWRK